MACMLPDMELTFLTAAFMADVILLQGLIMSQSRPAKRHDALALLASRRTCHDGS